MFESILAARVLALGRGIFHKVAVLLCGEGLPLPSGQHCVGAVVSLTFLDFFTLCHVYLCRFSALIWQNSIKHYGKCICCLRMFRVLTWQMQAPCTHSSLSLRCRVCLRACIHQAEQVRYGAL